MKEPETETWISLTEARRMMKTSANRTQEILDGARVRRRKLPHRIHTKYHLGDVEALLESAVTRGPQAERELASA